MRLFRFVLTLIVLIGAVAPARPLQAAQANQPAPPVVDVLHYPCGYGALIAPQAVCIYGQVRSAAGSLAGIEVTASWREGNQTLTLTDTTRQRPIDPVGEYGFTIPLTSETPLKELVGKPITLTATVDGREVRQRFLLSPDPVALVQQVDLFTEGGTQSVIFGRVYAAGEPAARIGQDVALQYTPPGTTQALTFTTTTGLDPIFGQPIYSFAQNIPAGTTITLAASDPLSPTLRVVRTFTWEGEAALIDLHLGWDCDYTIPGRSAKGLPERFCLALMVTRDGEPATGATVVASRGAESITATTAALPLLDQDDPPILAPQFNAALNLADLLEGADTTEEILVNVYQEEYAAQLRLNVGNLRGSSIAKLVNLELTPEWATVDDSVALGAVTHLNHTSAFGTIAIADAQVYRDLQSRRDFTPLGNPLPAPGRVVAECNGQLLALSAGGLYRLAETENVVTWEEVLPETVGFNGRALLVVGDTLIIGRGTSSEQIRRYANCGGGGLLSSATLGDRPVSALAQGGGALFAATEGTGMFRSTDAGAAWEAFNPDPASANLRVSALAVNEAAGSCTLYAAAAGAIYETTCAGAPTWTNLSAPPLSFISALGVARGLGAAGTLFAAGAGGLYQLLGSTWQRRANNFDGPRNLLAMAVQPTNQASSRIWLGSLNDGVWIYTNVDPEVDVQLSLGTLAARPDEEVAGTLTLRNIGGAPAPGLTATLALPFGLEFVNVDGNAISDASWSLSPLDLQPGQTRTIAFTVRMLPPSPPALIWSSSPQLTATISATPALIGDQPGNNSASEIIESLPAKAPDPSIALQLLDTVRPGMTSFPVSVLIDNMGELDAEQVQVTLSGDLQGVTLTPAAFTISRLPGSGSGWSCTNCRRTVWVEANAPLTNSDVFTLTATLTTQSADRLDDNNTATLRVDPGARPAYLLLTNLSRLEALEGGSRPNERARYAVRNFLADSGVSAAQLDVGPQINADLDAIDRLLRNDDPNDYDQIAELTMDVNMTVRKAIFEWIANNDPDLAYLQSVVIVGGDRVIPYGIVPLDVRSTGDNLAERAFAQDAREISDMAAFRRSPVHAALLANYYPADDIYGIAPDHDFVAEPTLPAFPVARLAERSTHIHSQLENYTQDAGLRNMPLPSQRGIIGYAPLLTEDQWNKSGSLWPEAIKLARGSNYNGPPLNVAILGGHGHINAIGDILIDRLRRMLQPSMPLVWTVSCHTGLSIFGGPSLPQVVISTAPSGDKDDRKAGGAYIGSIPYAYAAVDTIEYNERLALIFQEVLDDRNFHGKTIGAIVHEVKQRYVAERGGAEQMKPLDWKVIWGLALYGLPMQTVSNTTTMLVPQTQAAPAATAPTPAADGTFRLTLTPPISPTYTLDPSPRENWPTSGLPNYGRNADAVGRRGEGSTRQPYWQAILEPHVGPDGVLLVPQGVLFTGAAYDIYAPFDPFVVAALPLSQAPAAIHEPALAPLNGWEDTALLETIPLSDGRLHVRLWLGQYGEFAGAGYERLLRAPQLEVVYGPDTGADWVPSAQVGACVVGGQTNIAVSVAADADVVSGQAVYTTGAGSWERVALANDNGLLTAAVPSNPNLEFFVQLVRSTGEVATLAADEHSYFTPANARCGVYVEQGAIAVYDFNAGSGALVPDVSGYNEPLDLTITGGGGAWTTGGYTLGWPSVIRSTGTATKINTALAASGAFSIELWVTPATGSASSARLLTISSNPSQRNLTLQQGSFELREPWLIHTRLRTTASGSGGPALLTPAGALRAGELAHIVYTRDSSGTTQIYVNGVEVAAGTSVGTLNNWNSTYPLVLGGEADRTNHGWKGTYHLAAIYDRALTAAEIDRAYFAGPERR